MDFDALIQARLLRRYKRFLADVELPDGSELTVHCPNTGAMTGCAEPGSAVWLSTSTSRQRKYSQTWELVETAHGMACVHSALANKVVEEGVHTGTISGFDHYPIRRREVRYGKSSRADLLLTGDTGQVYVEVKSVTLCGDGGLGLFPDAVSERARKHLSELRSVLAPNVRALLLYCVFHNGIERVSAARDIDPAYADALAQAIAAGVEVQAWACDVSPGGIHITQRLPVDLSP